MSGMACHATCCGFIAPCTPDIHMHVSGVACATCEWMSCMAHSKPWHLASHGKTSAAVAFATTERLTLTIQVGEHLGPCACACACASIPPRPPATRYPAPSHHRRCPPARTAAPHAPCAAAHACLAGRGRPGALSHAPRRTCHAPGERGGESRWVSERVSEWAVGEDKVGRSRSLEAWPGHQGPVVLALQELGRMQAVMLGFPGASTLSLRLRTMRR